MVVHNRAYSRLAPIRYGVPQGSNLGLLLLLLYINDIFFALIAVNIIAYDDDSTMLISGKTEQEVFNKGHYLLECLWQWAIKDCLKIKANKTKGILFRPKNRTYHCNFDLVLENSKIEIVSAAKSLGVVFTESHSWDKDVGSVRLRIGRINGIVNHHVLPQQAKIMMYNAYILPII